MKDVRKFQQMYRDGQVNRREFLAAMGALGLSATAAGGLLTSAGALAATPKKGGLAKYANNLHGPDDQMDPIVFTSGIDYTRGIATYNGLIQFGDNMTLHPELAEEWSPNSNATEFTFKIRKGVEFHDGSPLTADDVVWSMNRHLGEDSPSVAKALFGTVKEWQKVDSHTVKAVLTSPDSDLPAKLGEKQAKVVKKDTVDFRQGNGTGPFLLESFEPGVRSTHSRNPNYWRDGANFEALELTGITDPQARVSALIAGDVDLINQVDTKGIRLIEQTDGVHVNSTPSGLYGGICCLKNTEPGSSDDFVKGMQYIQDRERIVRSILKGHGVVGNDHPISPAYGADHCHELPQRQYDPDKAKFHLDKSGYTSAELFVAPVVGGLEEACLLMQANLKKIGFDTEDQEGADGRVLGRGVDEGAAERRVLEPAPHRERDAVHPVRSGGGVERHLLEQRSLRGAAEAPACRDRCRQAPRDAVRDAGSGARRERHGDPLPREHPRRGERQDPRDPQHPAGLAGRLPVDRVRLAGSLSPAHRPIRRRPARGWPRAGSFSIT